jgi:peroxiredoxin Q/BCP
MATAPGLDEGAKVPDFAATLVTPAGDRTEVALSELTAESPVLLSFYTADFSPDCIDEWCAFRDYDWFSTTDDVQVVGISKSGASMHERFISYLDLGFPLYTDPDLEIADLLDVRYRTLGIFARSRRSCFLIDTEHTIRYRWIGEHWLDPTRDVPPVDEIYDALKEILAYDAESDADDEELHA